MNNEINIRGVIGEIPDHNGNVITPNTTFLDLVQQVESIKTPKELNVIINSVGGYVEEGTEMYNYLLALKNKGVQVNTYAQNVCASIATKVFAVGTNRVLLDNPEFMIHNPFGAPKAGDADYIENYSRALRETETDLLNFYSEITGTSVEAIKPLMKKETFLTPEQAVNLGFATAIQNTIEVKALAYFKNNNLNKKTMSNKALTKEEATSLLDKFSNRIKAFLDGKPKAKLVQDANGVEIDFPDLEDSATPMVGNTATIDGAAANGEVLMPNGETYVFESGVLTEIREAAPDDSDELMALKEQNVALEAKVATLEADAEKITALKSENETIKNLLKDFKEEIKDIKASLGSNFSYDPEKERKPKSTKRSVLKK